MPDLEMHCGISKRRTRDEYRGLHEWMDEPKIYLEHNHRIERHSYNEGYRKYIEKTWGRKGVVEWLFHIALDNLDTANKFAINVYNKAYGEILFIFDGKELVGCDFKKIFPHSKSIDSYKKKRKQ